jgi:hypothetical protein
MTLSPRTLRILLFAVIPLISLLMHLRVFTLDLAGIHVWRQSQTQTNVVNFAKEDFNILNPRVNNRGDGDGIFRMEFPVMQWSFAAAHKVLGDHIFISRFLTFIIGLFSVWGIFYLVSSITGNKLAALAGAWCFNFSPVFYYYTVNPLPDNLALACSIWGLVFFFRWIRNRHSREIVGSALMFSMATLAKLPFIVLAAPVAFYVLRNIFNKDRQAWKAAAICAVFFAAPALWYWKVIPAWYGNGVVQGIAAGVPWSEAMDILSHNLISTLPESLVNYGAMLFFVTGLFLFFRRKLYKNEYAPYLLAACAGVLAYFFYELNMISTVHDYYLFPFLPSIFIIVAYGAVIWLKAKEKHARIIGLVLLLILPVTAWLRMDHRWNPESPGFTKEYLAYRDELRSAAPANALCVVTDETPYVHLYYLDRKGWAFRADSLKVDQMEDAVSRGAKYFYCDKRAVDENPAFAHLLDTMIMQRGEVKVWKLSAHTEKDIAMQDIISIDTITSSGNALQVTQKGSHWTIRWGKEKADRIFQPSKDAGGPMKDPAQVDFLWDSEDFIILGYGCGSPCYMGLILPVNSTKQPFERWFPVTFTPVRGLLAYVENADRIVIESLYDKRKQEIVITDPKDTGANLWAKLDTVVFDGKFIVLKWPGHEKRYAISLN